MLCKNVWGWRKKKHQEHKTTVLNTELGISDLSFSKQLWYLTEFQKQFHFSEVLIFSVIKWGTWTAYSKLYYAELEFIKRG